MKQYSPVELHKAVENKLQKELKELAHTYPERLYVPVKYAIDIGGKRIRPILLLLAYNLFKENIEYGMDLSMSVEMFHNFTLLHDDIMDDAEIRRNSPTVFKKFDTNTAILSGDAMSILAYKYLIEVRCNNLDAIIRTFTKTALEVCEGQQLDMDFETRRDVKKREYLKMIELKTAVLLGCSLKIGALLAETDEESAQLLYDLGIHLGLAFQLQDDYLDSFGNVTDFGKKIGGDISCNKKTILYIEAMANADEAQKAEMLEWYSTTEISQKKLDKILGLYKATGADQIVLEHIDSHFTKVDELLRALKIKDHRKTLLAEFIDSLLKRNK
ncbi:MAG: polyprenyl synthetase family protein [Bacteroidales bacterium]